MENIKVFSDWFTDTSIAIGKSSFAIKIDAETVGLAQKWANTDPESIIELWNTGKAESELSAEGFPHVVSSVFVDPESGLLREIKFFSGAQAKISENCDRFVIETNQLLSPVEFVCYHYIIYWWFAGIRVISECWEEPAPDV